MMIIVLFFMEGIRRFIGDLRSGWNGGLGGRRLVGGCGRLMVNFWDLRRVLIRISSGVLGVGISGALISYSIAATPTYFCWKSEIYYLPDHVASPRITSRVDDKL